MCRQKEHARHTVTQTHRHSQTESHRHTNTHKHARTHTHTHTHTHTQKHIDDTHRHTQTDTNKQTHTHTQRQTQLSVCGRIHAGRAQPSYARATGHRASNKTAPCRCTRRWLSVSAAAPFCRSRTRRTICSAPPQSGCPHEDRSDDDCAAGDDDGGGNHARCPC